MQLSSLPFKPQPRGSSEAVLACANSEVVPQSGNLMFAFQSLRHFILANCSCKVCRVK